MLDMMSTMAQKVEQLEAVRAPATAEARPTAVPSPPIAPADEVDTETESESESERSPPEPAVEELPSEELDAGNADEGVPTGATTDAAHGEVAVGRPPPIQLGSSFSVKPGADSSLDDAEAFVKCRWRRGEVSSASTRPRRGVDATRLVAST